MKNINESELRNYIFKKLQESHFDELEFDDEAMKAAMSDINASGEDFEELGASKFEKDPKFKEKFKSALNRANLELPSDEEEVENLAQMMKNRKSHEEKFGTGSLNEIEIEHIKDANGKAIKLKSSVQHETGVNGYVERFMVDDDKNMLVKVIWIQDPNAEKLNPVVSPEKLIVKENTMMNEESYEASRYMFFSNLEQIRRQAGLLLDLDENKINEILDNGHDWAQDHIATAKESIDQVFDFIMNEKESGDILKSTDVEIREDEEEIEEGMGLSHTIGKGTNEKPVNYPEELMRESIKEALSEAFANYTSTSANARPVSFSKATLTKQHSTLSTWIQKKYPNVIVKMEMPAKTVDKKNPDALKPSVYLWIPTNNPNVINVEYRNVPNAVNTAKLQTTEILKAYPTLIVAAPLKIGKDANQATYSLTLKPEESKSNTPATTTKPALAESFMKEDEHFKLSFLDKIKLKLAGVSEEKALENLNNDLPIDWTGSVEGYYEKNEPIGNYSGTNEGLEEVLDNTDYYHNKEMLDYETQEDFNKEVYYVIDNDFNQKNYPDLVGKTFDTPPSYAQVKVIKQGEVELEKESSSDSLINKRGTNAKPNVSYLDEVDELEESSSNSLINKRGTNAKPNASYLKEGQVKQIAYLQDNEANYAFTLLKQDGPEEVIEYLKENNSLQEHKILSEIKNSPLDKTYEKDGYTLSWNSSVGYIKLYSKGIK
jgi:hypothetical protein